jgi:hypothetical protein
LDVSFTRGFVVIYERGLKGQESWGAMRLIFFPEVSPQAELAPVVSSV